MRPVGLLLLLEELTYPITFATRGGSAPTYSAAAPECPEVPSPPRGGPEPPRVANVPAVAEDLRRRVIHGIGKLSNDVSRNFGLSVLRGDALIKGQRDHDLMRAVGILAMLAPPEAAPIDLVPILHPTIDATRAEEDDLQNPAPTYEVALEKLTRSMADAARKRAADAKLNEDMLRGLRRAARASSEDPEDAPAENDEFYSPDELQRFVAEHGSPLHWVVQSAGAHYVLVGGTYKPPIPYSDLDASLPRDLSPAAAVDFTSYEKGTPRRKNAGELLRDYSTVARKIIADYATTRGRYDAVSETFFEAAGRRRRIAPQHDASVDKWLRLLGGTKADKLLDWVASVTRLDAQCAALYLSKSPGTGKTMLAVGLSRIWSEGGFTELSKIVDAWNSDLIRRPLVVADEHLPAQWRGQRTSAELRQLIGSSSRTVTRKHLPNVELKGSIRLMLLANDKQLLSLDEDLGTADMEAIAGRFLHIKTSPAAAEYLQELGGKERGTKTWVDGDAIAAHALWLADNRQVVHGKRFIVEGEADEMHRQLITGSHLGGLVCEVITRYLSASRPPQGAVAVRAGDCRLLASTTGICEQWDNYVKSEFVPHTHRIGKQLANMATETVRIGGQRYHVIREEYVLDWAEQNHIGDPDAMKAKILAPIPDAKVIEMKREDKAAAE